MTTNNPDPTSVAKCPPSRTSKATGKKTTITPETRQEILRLRAFYGTRQIATRVGESRRVVRRVLREEGLSAPSEPNAQSKLDPFLEPLTERVLKGLTISRVYREIRDLGYRGGRTIVAERVRHLRAQHAIQSPKKKVRRRFETDPGREMQVDWSPFRLQIGGRLLVVYALTVILSHCRKLFLVFYRDERQHTLLEGLASAFEYFEGCAIDLVLDNMATAVLGRWGPDRKPIWHPAFLDFARHYAINPIACAVRDPDRKGKIEKPFRLVYDDFLKGRSFRSWDDLAHEAAHWLDHDTTGMTGNLRIHGTTGQVPRETYLAERDFLIRLPRERYPVHEDVLRIVDNDCTLSVFDRKYSVPSSLANRTVPVRLFAHHFEVIDPNGRVAFSRVYAGPEEKRKLILDRTHYAGLPRRPKGSHNPERLDEAFLSRFPTLAALVDGLKFKMKTLAPIHLRKLLQLTEAYGQDAFLTAATRAQTFRRFDALAVQRILERDHPEPAGDPPGPLGGNGATVLGEVDAGTLDGYGHFDEDPVSHQTGDDTTPGDDKDKVDDADEGDTHGS